MVPDAGLSDSVARLTTALASPDPVPAGGAAAVTAVAMGIGLGRKVIHFSIAADETLATVAEHCDAWQRSLLPLFAADCAAYAGVLAAYRLPRQPPAPRRTAITAAFGVATEIPLQVAAIAAEARSLLAALVGRSNPNLACDLAAGLELIAAGARISLANARSNAAHLDPASATGVQTRLQAIATQLVAAAE